MNTTTSSFLSRAQPRRANGGGPPLFAQTAPGDFKAEPDKTLAAAHEFFVKGNLDKAGKQNPQGGDLREAGVGQSRRGLEGGREEGR